MGVGSRPLREGTSRSTHPSYNLHTHELTMILQAFESVVPSERTRVNVKILDTSIRLLAPSHPGAVVPYIGELDFSTVIEGNSPTSTINLSIPALALLLIDDISSSPEDSDASGRAHASTHGVGFWKVGVINFPRDQAFTALWVVGWLCVVRGGFRPRPLLQEDRLCNPT